MRDEAEAFSPEKGLSARGYRLLQPTSPAICCRFPFNALDAHSLLQQRTCFRAAGLDPESGRRKTWPEVGAAAKAACAPPGRRPAASPRHGRRGSTSRTFSGVSQRTDRDQGQWPRRARRGYWTFNNPLCGPQTSRRACDWQSTKVVRLQAAGGHVGRAAIYQNGGRNAGIFNRLGRRRAPISAPIPKFEIGYGMLPYWPDVEGARRKTPSSEVLRLWGAAGPSARRIQGCRKVLLHSCSKPEVQAAWHQKHRDICRSPRAALRSHAAAPRPFYDRNPGAADLDSSRSR